MAKETFNATEELNETGQVASFDIGTPEGVLRLINAKNGASASLKNLADSTSFNVVGALCYKDTIDNYGHQQEAVVTVFYDSEGKAYNSISPTIMQVAIELIPLLKNGIFEEIKVTLVKAKSNNDQEYLSLIVG